MDPLTLLAATRNKNRNNPQAGARIAEIYQLLKTALPVAQADRLVREALALKLLSPEEIETLLASRIQLFCFPYAGGNKWMYETWQQHLPATIQLRSVEYPGRGTKAKENLSSSLSSLLDHLEKELIDSLNQPFAFFGHSLGAMVAFELAIRIEEKQGLRPKVLYLSGCPAPHTAAGSLTSMSRLDDLDFIKTLQSLKGIPPSIVDTQEFKTFFLPIIRSDFSLMNGYQRQLKQYPFPLVLFGSALDPIAPFPDLAKWSDWTKEKIQLHEFEGDHFFIHESKPVLDRIKETLCRF